MSRLSLGASGLALACLASAHPIAVHLAAVQDDDRIWGRVETVSGDRYEGFLHWRGRGANDAASWVDFFVGRAEAISQHYEDWLAATGTTRPIRTIEARGWRVSWNEDHPDFPRHAPTPIRFGRLASVTVLEDGGVELALRADATAADSSGARLGRGQALGVSRPHRQSLALVVEEPGGDRKRLAWRELGRVEFAAPPPGVRAESSRLHGTVEDRFGRAFTGYVAWDSDEVLGEEELDGWDQYGEDREIAFADIASIERSLGGSRVVLKSGEALEMSGTNDVEDGNRGVRIFDPSLGMVEVEWDEFGVLRLHPSAEGHAEYGSFPGSRPLVGTVATHDGETLAGRLRWDGQQEWSWEVFQARSDEVKLSIEFDHIVEIARSEEGDARVTLLDGRSFDLSEAPELEENRGLFVFPDGDAGLLGDDPGAPWHYVPWEELREVRFWDTEDATRPDEGQGRSSRGRGL